MGLWARSKEEDAGKICVSTIAESTRKGKSSVGYVDGGKRRNRSLLGSGY